MSLDLNVSTLKNTVTFVVDKNSIAQAKKAADDLHKYFQKIQDPKIRFQAQKQRRQKARQMVDDAKFNTSPKNTSDMKQQRIAEKAAKAQAREAAKIAKRNEVADLKFRSANMQMKGIAGKYGLDAAAQHKFALFAKQQTELFRTGQQTAARMNHEIREQLTLLRRSAAAQQRLTTGAQAQSRAVRSTNKRMDYKGAISAAKERGLNLIGGGPGLIASTAAAAAGAGLMYRIKQKGDENLNLIRMSERVKTNPNAIKTMVAWGQQHGVDSANVDKATDNMKDVRERLAMTVNDAQMKNGEWKGGDGGITAIMNKFGWSKEQISKFQDSPLDFIQATVNEGQRRGMKQAQIGTLIESLGDDLMHYTDMFLNNGAEYNKTLQQLVDSGQTLNDEQIKQTLAYGDLNVAMGNLMNGIDNSLFTGFMKGFADGGDELVRNTQVITQTTEILGTELGNLTKNITGFVGEISWVVSDLNSALRSRFPEWFSDSSKPATQALYDGATGSADSAAGWIQEHTGWNPQTVGQSVKDWLGFGTPQAGTAASNYGLNGDTLRNSAMSLNSGNAPAYNLSPVFNLQVNPQVGLTLQSDVSRLSDYIDWSAKASADSFTRSLTLQINSGQSSTGG
ncbi:hypothetical protein ACXEJV_001137 [Klebsiella pneumoniae]